MSQSRKERLEAMLVEDPGDPFLRYGLAMEHVSVGDDTTAVGCFQELLRMNPTYVPAYLQAGQVLTRLGRDHEARALYQQGITAALSQGDTHAANEMQGFLDNLNC